MATKKSKKKINLAENNQSKPVSLSFTDFVTRSITDNDRCSCGGHVWSYMVDGRIVRKCGDCGYIF